jgi:glycosyltransferase involved in cell wall biosynthesis
MMTPEPLRVIRAGTSVSLNTILRNQLRMLQEMGYDILCVCDEDEWTPALREADLNVYPLGMGRRPGIGALLRWTVRFYRLLRTEQVDIVHTVNAFHGIGGRIAARLAGVPVVVQTVHNWYYLEPPSSRRARVFLRLERFAGRLSDKLLFINHDDFALATERRIVAPGKRAYIGNGIDIAAFQAKLARHDRAGARQALGIAETDRAIAMIARLEAPKDHSTLLCAFAQLQETVPEALLILAGHGLRTEEIKAEAAGLGLGERVRFLGYFADTAAVLRAADLAVLISHHEGFGRVLVEGMVAGLPVIGTNVVGIRDVIAPESTGLLVSPRDPAALAAALHRLLTDRELAERLARNGLVFALEHFDERLPAERVDVIYRELAAAKLEPSRHERRARVRGRDRARWT